MRKLLRAKLMYDAKRDGGKTIRVFNNLWKKEVVERRPVMKGTITHTMEPTPQPKKKSMLSRTVKKLFGR